MAGQGLPSDLDFTLKKAAPRGIRQFRTALAPIGGVPSSGITDYLRWDIGTGRKGQYLDTTASYITLKVKAGATDAITLDGSVYALFERLTVLSGGAVLEDIVSYGNMAQLYLDNQMSEDKRRTDSNMLLGMSSASPLDGSPAGGFTSLTNQNVIQRRGVTIPANGVYTFCVPLISGILGSNGSSKYLPIGAILNDLRCEIQLATQSNAVISTNSGTWSLQEANFMLSIIELDSEVQNMIDAATGGNYYISSETFKWYSNTVGSGSTADSLLIPARFSSVKGLIGSFRGVTNQNNYLASSIAARINPFYHVTNACSLQFQIGSQLYPSSPIRSAQEVYAEVVKYFHAFGNLDSSSAINQSNWNIVADPGTAAVANGNPGNAVPALAAGNTAAQIAAYVNGIGTGCFAINLDNVSNRSDVMSSGLNTLTSNIILNMSYGNAPVGSQRVDVYAHIDMVICVEGGILTVRV